MAFNQHWTLRRATTKNQKGFTLIETIVGIVVLSIAFSIFTTLIYPLANQSAEQVHQIKAAELGQSLINEILGKAYDHNSDMSGGLTRCGDTGAIGCTTSNSLGPEVGETRSDFNDVDDYHELTILADSLGNSVPFGGYIGYELGVEVKADSNYDGASDTNSSVAKLITVTVTTPQDFDFVFSVYRVNF
jgi:MSHA pilin protein MshD